MNRTAGAIILRISHGYEVKENNDPFVKLAEQATEQFSLSTAPGGFMVDLIPACATPPFPFSYLESVCSTSRPDMVSLHGLAGEGKYLGCHAQPVGRTTL